MCTILDTGIQQDMAEFSGVMALETVYVENVCTVDNRYWWLIIGTLHCLSLALDVFISHRAIIPVV